MATAMFIREETPWQFSQKILIFGPPGIFEKVNFDMCAPARRVAQGPRAEILELDF